MMEAIRFTIPEVLSLIGVFQCVYILVHISFRVQKMSYVTLPLIYFIVLGAAFFIDLARGSISQITPYYEVISWATWMSVTPLSVLLIIQLAKIKQIPKLANWFILLLVPIALTFSALISNITSDMCSAGNPCPELLDWLNISGVIAGAMSLLVIWGKRTLFEDILSQKAGKERYWLILSLVLVNIFLLSLSVMLTSQYKSAIDISLLRTVLGLSFVYLVSTSLFRIYPNALSLSYQRKTEDMLSDEDKDLGIKIESLLNLEKIYHEPTYSRSDLARELDVADATVSRVINIYFKKSFPQLLNEYRVDDSKRLLLETSASIKVIAEEVGFNSLPSFNRVFKDVVGQSPSSYRKYTVK